MKKKQQIFFGKLGEPIAFPDLLVDERHPEIAKLRRERFNALPAWFGVPDDDPEKWRTLCWRMACELVPGMSVADKTRRGRKITWTTTERRKLVDDVDEICARQPCGINEAIALATGRGGAYQTYPPQSLRTRYYEAKSYLEPPPGHARRRDLPD